MKALCSEFGTRSSGKSLFPALTVYKTKKHAQTNDCCLKIKLLVI